MKNSKVDVSRINEKDIPAVVDVLCDAFFDYPVMRFVLGSEQTYAHRLEILINFFVMARILRREVILAVGEPANIAGIALVSRPDRIIEIPELNLLGKQVWKELGAKSRARYQKYGDISHQFKIEQSHLHLNLIGIRKQAQGMGLGGRLINHVHALSMQDPHSTGITLSTEDPAKVPFYKYLGYQVIGQAAVTRRLTTWSFFRPDKI